MASIKYDTELMVNHIAAVPVAAKSSMVTLLDDRTRRPAVLGISNEPKPSLELITEDSARHHKVVDLGAVIGVKGQEVQAFNAQQDSNLQIYLIVASKIDDQRSNVFVVKPFKLSSIDRLPTIDVQTIPTVEEFFMGPATNSDEWPLAIAAHKRFDRSLGGSDLTRLSVQKNSWQALKSLEIPVNASRIIDVAAATSSTYGRGIWALYEIQGEVKLTGEFASADFDNPNKLDYYRLDVPCPQGATAIETFLDESGETAVLIGAAAGLHLLSATDSVDGGIASTIITQDAIFKSPLKMQIAQDGSFVTAWSLGTNGALGYLTTQISQIATLGTKAYALFPEGMSANFATAISQPDNSKGMAVASQSIVSDDKFGNLTLLQQNRDTGLWKSEPFVVGDNTQVYDVNSYTFSVTALDVSCSPATKGAIKVTSSSTCSVIHNGMPYNISSLGSWLPLDEGGEMNLIVSTDGVAGRTLIIDGMRDGKGNDLAMSENQFSIDPSKKVMAYFAGIDENTDMTTLKGRNKTLLYGSNDQKPSANDLKQAAMCFSKLHQAANEVPADGSKKVAMTNSNSGPAEPGDFLADAFHWVKEKVHDAVNWVVQKIGDLWHFTCEIAGEVKKFILDCAEKIGEAFQWVWTKIKKGFSELVEFAGFIFGWDDITATKNTISSLLTAGLEFSAQKIGGLENKVNQMFDKIQSKLDERPSLDTQANTSESQKHDGQSGVDAQQSPGFKWMGERLKNGAAATGTTLKGTVTHIEFSGEPTWEDIVKPLGQSIRNLAKDLAHDVSKLFGSKKSLSSGQLWEKLGKDMLKDFLDVIRQVVLSMLKLAQKLLTSLKKLGNAPIHIPVISPLWERLMDHELTLFDTVCLILGFMTCILTKIITQKAPPSLGPVDTNFFQQLVDGKVSDENKRAITVYGTALSLNVTIIHDIISVIKLSYQLSHAKIAEVVGAMSPSAVMMVIHSVVGAIGLIGAIPSDTSVPGWEERSMAVGVGMVSIASGVLFQFISIGGDESDKKAEILSLILELVNFCLFEAVFVAEMGTKANYEDKDTGLSVLGSTENLFTTISAIGKCVAVETIDEEPEVAAVGVVVMQAAVEALTVNKGLTFMRVSQMGSKTVRGCMAAP